MRRVLSWAWYGARFVGNRWVDAVCLWLVYDSRRKRPDVKP
jgi:hypothetical protein